MEFQTNQQYFKYVENHFLKPTSFFAILMLLTLTVKKVISFSVQNSLDFFSLTSI